MDPFHWDLQGTVKSSACLQTALILLNAPFHKCALKRGLNAQEHDSEAFIIRTKPLHCQHRFTLIMPAQIKAVWFDFMGTCLDWHSTIVEALPPELSAEDKSNFALEWRQLYFETNTKRLAEGRPVMDFDETQRQVLNTFLDMRPHLQQHFPAHVRERLVSAWHKQKAWPEVAEAVRKLKQEHGLEVFVHANGSTRLQLDLVKSAGLQFDMLFSSELLGHYKPSPESFLKAMQILKLKPEECVMVAAHAHDVLGAKAVGMKTVYIYRWTDDILEDQNALRDQFDAYLLDMKELDTTITNL